MNTRLSKLMRSVIILNVVITLIAIAIHGYHMHWSYESNDQIVTVMEEKQVIRDTAIRILEDEGVELFIPQGMSYFFGLFISFLTLFLLYVYSQTNGFFAGFFAAFCAVFTSFIGGFLLFYVFFSNKSEKIPNGEKYSFKNEWQKYIHEKSALT